MISTPDDASATTARNVVELDSGEAMRLLASIDHGRVVFTRDALPAFARSTTSSTPAG